jgi:cytochrome c oxidase assembly protein subunit 15
MWVAITASVLVYIQCILGGLVGSRWALHQCFNDNQLCVVMNSHIIGVFPATIATLTLFVLAWRTPALSIKLRNLANLGGSLVFLQVILGIATFYLHLQVEPLTIIHHTVGAALLGTLVAFSILGWRDLTINN